MELLGSVMVAAVAAALAYSLGLRRARIESRSARRLTWLEKAQAQLLAVAGDLNNARAADLAGIVGKERDEFWDKALLALGELRHLGLCRPQGGNTRSDATAVCAGPVVALARGRQPRLA